MKSARIRETVYTEYGIYYKLQHMTTWISRQVDQRVSLCMPMPCQQPFWRVYGLDYLLGSGLQAKTISTAGNTKHRYYCVKYPNISDII